jgi:predicted ATPase/DNA-binding XRE family transcriptional regulator
MEGASSQVGPSAFGSLLRRYRIAAGLSQEGLAERARISMQAVGALERGHRRAPQRETLSLLIEALALDAEQRASFEAVARRSAARAIGRGVTEGPWPTPELPMLPLALTNFVGHESALREVAELLRTHRLVTLTGPGGIGKTRIALEIGNAAIDSGTVVRLVELAAVAQPEHVASSIAAALGMQTISREAVLDSVARYFRRERVLLVLDNCEHVIAEAARVAEFLLRACPMLRILATSREALRVAGEIVYRVPPLVVPALGEAGTLDAHRAGVFSAIALFVERAQTADRRFLLTDENAGSIGRICAQLDGMPLAIELAAARVNVLSVESIAKRLDSRFALLARGDRNAPARHQRMWHTIAWSYELLSEVERRVFERLSIFRGGCTLGVAEAVCVGEGVTALQVFESLTSLADKSLAIADTSEAETRYRMLESFREFAREQCARHEDLRELSKRHAASRRRARHRIGCRSASRRPSGFGKLACGHRMVADRRQRHRTRVLDRSPSLASLR